MIDRLLQIATSRYLVWLLLALPAWPFAMEFAFPDRYYPEMMHRSGELSVQLLVATLCITPISLGLKRWKPTARVGLWLIRNRRYFGLASFGYAGIHTLLYLRQIGFDLELAWLEALDLPFGSGWIAVLLMLAVALTSNNWSTLKLRANWKAVQRFTYPAAVATFVHWLLLDFFLEDVLIWLYLLCFAKAIQVFVYFSADRNRKI